jgi:hypothetical protein
MRCPETTQRILPCLNSQEALLAAGLSAQQEAEGDWHVLLVFLQARRQVERHVAQNAMLRNSSESFVTITAPP